MIAPYYEDDYATIYHGNALEVIPALGAGSVDALITDPPYGVLDVAWDVPVYWECLVPPLLKPGGFVCAFGLLMTLAPVCGELEAAGLEREAEMVWSRGTLGTGGDRFGRSHELFAIHYMPPRQAPRVDRVRVPYAPASKPSPSHNRHAMGAVMRRARSSGVCTPSDSYVPSRRPESHGRPIRVWVSTP